MEILALLLLGLIAMLAIVPPIIRGKLEDSPLVTTQTFQRSMQEIAHSLKPQGENVIPARSVYVAGGLPAGARTRRQIAERAVSKANPRRKAAVRRNRILATLTLLTAGWGSLTLACGRLWCLVIFAVFGCLLAVYWALTLIVPSLTAQPERESEMKHTAQPQNRRLA